MTSPESATAQTASGKQECWLPVSTRECPASCAGLLATKFIKDEHGGEGFEIMVCPNPQTVGRTNSEAVMCGNGPDLIIMHRDTIPTEEEYAQAVRQFDQ